MSNREWKRARRRARPIIEAAHKRAEGMRALPWWRALAAAAGFPGPARRWADVWARKDARARAKALRRGAAAVVKLHRDQRAEMRPGAPAAPRVAVSEAERRLGEKGI